MSGPSSRLAWVAAALLAAGPVHAQGFFGPQGSTSYQPEVDAYFQVGKGLRLQAQVQPYLVPAQQVAQISFALYGAWMVAAVLQDLLSPDVAKEHAVDLRVGVLYNADVDPGTQGPGNTWTLQADLTPRFNLPARAPGLAAQPGLLQLAGGRRHRLRTFATAAASSSSASSTWPRCPSHPS